VPRMITVDISINPIIQFQIQIQSNPCYDSHDHDYTLAIFDSAAAATHSHPPIAANVYHLKPR
jgi:hypothetical protein